MMSVALTGHSGVFDMTLCLSLLTSCLKLKVDPCFRKWHSFILWHSGSQIESRSLFLVFPFVPHAYCMLSISEREWVRELSQWYCDHCGLCTMVPWATLTGRSHGYGTLGNLDRPIPWAFECSLDQLRSQSVWFDFPYDDCHSSRWRPYLYGFRSHVTWGLRFCYLGKKTIRYTFWSEVDLTKGTQLPSVFHVEKLTKILHQNTVF